MNSATPVIVTWPKIMNFSEYKVVLIIDKTITFCYKRLRSKQVYSNKIKQSM